MNRRRRAGGGKSWHPLALTAALLMLPILGVCGGGPRASAPAAERPQVVKGLDDRVGWYRMPAGDTALVTYSAKGGLRLFSLWDTIYATTFVPGADGLLHAGGPDAPVVEFREWDGRVTGFEWPVGSGSYAERLPGYGYQVEPFAVEVEGVTLAGSLFLPRDRPNPVPGAVIIHGSGASDRDNYWYMTFADTLVRSGLAVMLPDKRGSGQSGGDWFTTGLAGFADDVAAQVQALREHSAVDPGRVGLVGMSQGGHIAPMVAPRVDPAFVVNISGSAVPLNEQIVHELSQDMKRDQLPGILDAVVRPISVWVVKRRRPEWWATNGPIDPIEHWAEVTAPAVTLYGRLDESDNVPVARSVERLDSLGLPNLDVWVFEGVGHGLMIPDPNRVRPDILERLAEWVADAISADAVSGAADPGTEL
ncbi:MAG TPA: alpha/beta fold hydrolase [Gemmatimonadota bacterium]|nr:alpha/beta fold hydrolase [Gemmatimonadota bacterium]